MSDNDLQCCPKCKTHKDASGFYASAWGKRGRYCKSCHRGIYSRTVEQDPEYFLRYQRMRRARLNPNTRPKKADNHTKRPGHLYCARCEQYRTEEFWTPALWAKQQNGYCRPCSADYTRGKMATDPWYRERTKLRVQSARARLGAIKLAMGCKVCGYAEHAVALDFHHRDPASKKFTVASRTNCNWERLLTEVAKCDLLCANCHRVQHERDRQARLQAVADVTASSQE